MSDPDTRNEASLKPNDTLGDKIANAFDGHDDPKRGPIDRLANAIDGTDDPNKGPIDRAQNAIEGTDFPNKELTLKVLTCGSDGDARETAKQLKTSMIKRHRPVWTVAKAPYQTNSPI